MNKARKGHRMKNENKPLTAEINKLIGKTSFSVSARVAMQLGRESISSSITAIVELVKNAYDADADHVRIRFAHLGTPEAVVVIEDDGDGMSIDILRDHWLVIGTDNKARRRTTGKKRIVTGEKGLGRLGLDRLCTQTVIESLSAGAIDGVRLDVDWRRYEDTQARLETVQHDIYSIPDMRVDPITQSVRDYPKGTRLILRGLKDEWNRETVRNLRNELALLLSPFNAPNDFQIEIESGMDWDDVDGHIYAPAAMLNAANWKVIATLDEENRIAIQMTSPLHKKEYQFKPTRWSEAIKKMEETPRCGPLRMEFYFFVRGKNDLYEQEFSRSEITSFLKFNQGIRIYRDNFRVKPYGEPDGSGDWLRLAYARMQNPDAVAGKAVPGAWRIGYNQVVGAVFISHDKNPDLDDQTNREGLLQGKAFIHLIAFAEKVIQWFQFNHQTFEIERKATRAPIKTAEDKAQESIAGAGDTLQKIETLAYKITDMLKPSRGSTVLLPKSEDIQKAASEIQVGLEKARSDYKQTIKLFQQVEEQKNTMANLASLGILAAAFGHETLDWTVTVAENAHDVRANLFKKTFMVTAPEEERLNRVLLDMAGEADKVRKFAQFTIGNLNRRKRTKQNFCLKETIHHVFSAFDEVIKKQRNITVDISAFPTEPCLIHGFQMDWESVVVNLITNAVWALEDKPAKERRIRATLSDGKNQWVFSFDDSGCGLEAGTESFIFNPTFTTKRKRGEIDGTGMGLYIVKSFVENNSHGTISAVRQGQLGGAGFTIKVPKAIK